MNRYKALEKNSIKNGVYSIVPIRFEDRLDIMNWRNEQIYHLRQNKPLIANDQDQYFTEVVERLFEKEQPDQFLFSFLKDNKCIGYGGLVHINWIDRHAEISFIMETSLEKLYFEENWSQFLRLIEIVGFQNLNFRKLFTYAFDLRPHLYPVLEGNGYKKEARLVDHCFYNGNYKDVLIHAKLSHEPQIRPADFFDESITYSWGTNPIVRKYSFSQEAILPDEHSKWFHNKLESSNCYYWIIEMAGQPIGSFRVDLENSEGTISFLLAPAYHGRGLGKKLFALGIKSSFKIKSMSRIVGFVMNENISSQKLFELHGFNKEQLNNNIKYTLKTK
ncbi:MAG: GNAT family N-acetyltransferase [Salibacteraceae bacterium]